MKNLLLVFLGGGTGSMLRYLLGKYFQLSSLAIPVNTFAINVLGSFLIGLILGWSIKNQVVASSWTLLLATGFCGGFTTFSTFAYENHTLLKAEDFGPLIVYILGSLFFGILAVFLGLWITK